MLRASNRGDANMRVNYESYEIRYAAEQTAAAVQQVPEGALPEIRAEFEAVLRQLGLLRAAARQ